MTDSRFSRRQLLQGAIIGIAAVPAASLIVNDAHAAEPLAESDPAAKSLAYVTDVSKVDPKANPTYKAGQHCGNCIQYTGKAGSGEGPCNIFPNKTVKEKGWCKVWVLKPGSKPA
ncbi:MAG: high-potential iron-sulfur protein [Steroidobacteraceae bacterium]